MSASQTAMVRFAADIAAAAATHEPPPAPGSVAGGTVRPEETWKMPCGLEIQ